MTKFPSTPTRTGGRVSARRSLLFAATVAVLIVGLAESPSTASSDDPRVTVREERGIYSVTVTFGVERTATAALDVLTDYDRIAQFMPDLRKSQVLERSEGRVVIEQEATPRLLVFSRTIHLRLEIVESPGTLRFKDTCGQSFSAYEGAWRIEERDGRTSITYELQAKPAFDVPGFVLKRLLARDVGRMVDALRREITTRSR